MANRNKGHGPRPNVDFVTMAQNHGGFSEKESSGNWGKSGAYSALEGSELVVEGPLRSTDVMQFRRQNAERLAEPGAYFGGYREPEGIRQKSPERAGDETYLDVSRRFIGPQRLERAREFARGQGQISVFDTDAGLAYTHENPEVPEDSKYEYSAHMAQSAREQKQARSLKPGAARTEHVEAMVDSIFAAQNLKR